MPAAFCSEYTGTLPNFGGVYDGPYSRYKFGLTTLQELELNDNMLAGTINPLISKLTVIKKINIANNQLTGRIPESMGALGQLGWLELSNNQLSFLVNTPLRG